MTGSVMFADRILALILATSISLGAEPPGNLKHRFAGLMGDFGSDRKEAVKILSGPEPVEMLRGESPGKVWQASLGDTKFKITIEDKLILDIGATFDRLQHLPDSYRRALAIVSEGKKDGIAFYADLDGAAAHGSQDYLNLVPHANALVIAHEAGHVLEQRATVSEPATLARWKDAIATDKVSVSDYGDGAVHEDLAEFAFLYAVCLDAGPPQLARLKELSPRRFAHWEKILHPAPQTK